MFRRMALKVLSPNFLFHLFTFLLTWLPQTLSPAKAADLDKELMTTGGFSLDQLMELAGLSVAEAVYRVHSPANGPNVLVACGPGNNGVSIPLHVRPASLTYQQEVMVWWLRGISIILVTNQPYITLGPRNQNCLSIYRHSSSRCRSRLPTIFIAPWKPPT
jgi:hypothetical protein